MEWQPIETAPKSKYILLGYTQQGDEMPRGLFVGIGICEPSEKIWVINSWDNEKVAHQPTGCHSPHHPNPNPNALMDTATTVRTVDLCDRRKV